MRIIVTGQMRTGTTLLANVLTAQPHIRVVADFLHIERLKNEAGVDSLNDPLTLEQKKNVIARFVGTPGSDGVEAITDATGAELRFDTDPARFETLLEFYLDILEQTRSSPDDVVGHKTTCAEPVLEELLRAVGDLKCVYMIRDPRDVALSNARTNAQPPPLVFENWTQGLNSARRIQGDQGLADRLAIVRYDDLVTRPEATLDTLARFLGIDDLVVPSGVTWHGTSFVANSSFGDVKKLFDPVGSGRWKTMDTRIGLLAEVLIARDMRRAGYDAPLLMKLHGRLTRWMPPRARRWLLEYRPRGSDAAT